MKVVWSVNDGEEISEVRDGGKVPIMLVTVVTWRNCLPDEMVAQKEESDELGGLLHCQR